MSSDNWDSYDDGYDDPDYTNDEDGETRTVACSNCKSEVYEDAEQCPSCGEYIIASGSSPFDGKPMWWVALGLAGIIAVVLALTSLV